MEEGTGYKGTHIARACAQVTSGPATDGFWAYPISRRRKIEEGDPVTIELGVVADGFWADVARVRSAGKPSALLRQTADAVIAAQDAAATAARPGVTGRELDTIARETLVRRGYQQNIVHSLGHGLGFRWHEPIPSLDHESEDVLKEGMVLALEPGLYVPGFVGVRYENNVIVTASGPEILTTFDRVLF